MSLVATPGTTANTYATLAEANSYHQERLHNDTWWSASDNDKERALKWATNLLDEMDWKGSKADEDNSLRWPRSSVYDKDGVAVDESTIPQFLKNAVSEYAWELIKEDREIESDNAGIKEVMAGAVQVKFDKYDRNNAIPPSISKYISHYLDSSLTGNTISLVRV